MDQNRKTQQMEEKKQQMEDTKAIGNDITVIANSPFVKKREGREIVDSLRSLNNRGMIVYGETLNGARGSWDGHEIVVKEAFRDQVFSTITTIVHEATHAVWRKKHPTPNPKDQEARCKDYVEGELHAEENELAIYKYLKVFGCEDLGLELELQHQADGTLREVVAEEFARARQSIEIDPRIY